MGKKLTQIDFIKKAKKVHGDRYDYSKVEYKDSKTKVCIICPIHGEFWQTPNGHLNGSGCEKCYHQSQRLTTEEFINRARKIHNNKYDYSKVECINVHTKVCIICPIHGEFWQTPHTHLKGSGCNKCSHKLSTDDFIKKAKLTHGNKYDYSKSVYTGALDKICIICPIHGEFWQEASAHIRGQGCPYCCGKHTDTERFIKKAKEVHGDKYDYSKVNYIDNKTKICIICPTHGEFCQAPRHHLKGAGCNKCKDSHLEKEILMILEKNGIEYINHCNNLVLKWLGKQHLDFYLPKYNIAIECQGRQHFSPTNFGSKTISNEKAFENVLKRDAKKKKLCTKNNVKLLYYSNLGIEYPYDVIESEKLLIEKINEQK